MRGRNTNSRGGSWTKAEIEAVWKKGTTDPRYNSNLYRADKCGNWMEYAKHGKTEKFGWEIDHIKPVALGGGDDLSNLQPLFWENNRKKGDTYPWSCV